MQYEFDVQIYERLLNIFFLEYITRDITVHLSGFQNNSLHLPSVLRKYFRNFVVFFCFPYRLEKTRLWFSVGKRARKHTFYYPKKELLANNKNKYRIVKFFTTTNISAINEITVNR